MVSLGEIVRGSAYTDQSIDNTYIYIYLTTKATTTILQKQKTNQNSCKKNLLDSHVFDASATLEEKQI